MRGEKLFDLTGRVALVTGGAGHLGAAMCQALVQAGAHVHVASRDQARCRDLAGRLRRLGDDAASAVELDVSDQDSVRACLRAVEQASGRLDILVNNAAFYAGLTLDDTGEEEWLAGLDGAVHGAFRCLKAAAPLMATGGGGSVINISSMYALVSPDPSLYTDTPFGNPPSYGAGKAAMLQLTRYAACHLAPKGIRVNAISPGPFPNPKVQENNRFVARLAAKTPLGRIGRPEELGGAVVFLASSASSYVTGSNLVVDGGWTAW